MATILQLPHRYDIRRPPRRRRRTKCPVVQLPTSRQPQASNQSAAYDLYLEASQIDENPATAAKAENLYRQAIELDPRLSIAYTNLGNIRFRAHDPSAAEFLYRQALVLDPRQPEALYNLGYLELERGNPEQAIPLLRAATEADPRFADAHFNLAMALEQAGNTFPSQRHWREYLKLEPVGTWAEIARRHLTLRAI